MTGVSECGQQRGNLKDNGYIPKLLFLLNHHGWIYYTIMFYL
ncbi:hypothetical protein [Photorhabdus bodei]|nr:hypothetical protein [Photorhabdus bodei]